MNTILHLVLSAFIIGIVAYILPGASVTVVGALIAAVVIAALNMFIKPIIVILTLPINIITLGIFSLFINAFLVWLASQIVPGFVIGGFWTAFVFAILLAILSAVFGLNRSHA